MEAPRENPLLLLRSVTISEMQEINNENTEG